MLISMMKVQVHLELPACLYVECVKVFFKKIMSCNHCFLYVAGLLVAFAYGMFVCVIKVTFLYVLATSTCKKVINSDICALYNADVLNIPVEHILL